MLLGEVAQIGSNCVRGLTMLPEKKVFGPPESFPDVGIGRFMFDKILSYGDKPCQVDVLTGKTVTFREVLMRSISVAAALKLQGLRPGQVVAVMSENSVDFFVPVLASFFLGTTCATVCSTYTTRELLHTLNISRPAIIFSSPTCLSTVKAARSRLHFVRSVVVFGQVPESDCIMFSTLLEPKTLDFEVFDTNPERHVAIALCTSGTTGLPKCAAITSRSLVASIAGFLDPRVMGIDPDHVMLCTIPFFHVFGFGLQIACLTAGVKVIILPKFSGDIFLRAIQEHKVTFLPLVPTLMTFLAKDPSVDQYDTSSLREIWCGAAPLREKLHQQVVERLGIQNIRQGYGSTETQNTTHMPPGRLKHGSSGVLLPGMQCKVLDIVSGAILGPHEEGELCFKGPQRASGYLHNPQATADSFDSEGFYHTGDIGYYDEEGFFFIIDRIKDLIKYKGYQVPPAELEAVLLTHPSVKEAAVIGIPDRIGGELAKAFVVTKPHSIIKEEEILKFVADKVSPQKRLRGGVEFVSSLPKSSSGKILRRELRQMNMSKL